MNEVSVIALWNLACNGDIDLLKSYYNKYPDGINRRYNKFGAEHSLIMGAFRNNQFETVKYLMSVGETITEEEKREISIELKKIDIMRELIVSN